MAFRFSFEVSGVQQFNRSFSRIEGHIEDLRPVWNIIDRVLFDIEDKQFKSEGAAGSGGKWKKLSRGYAKQKEKTHPGMPILQRTGRLMKSLTGKTGDTILIKDKDEFAFGTSVEYAGDHQRGKGILPQRAVIDFSESQKTELQKGIQRGLIDIIRKDVTWLEFQTN